MNGMAAEDKVLITGASGFLGKYIAGYLADRQYQVLAYSRTEVDIKGVKWLKGDILDFNRLYAAMSDCSIVIHLAAVTPYEKINQLPLQAWKVYVKGTMNVLEAFACSGGGTFIFPSSGKVYGEKNSLPFSEDQSLYPDLLMGKLKAAVESEIHMLSEMMGGKHRFIIARIFNVYGYGQKPDFLIPRILNHLVNGTITLGPADIERDYIYINDILTALQILIERAPNGCSIFNIGSGYPVSIREIVEKISIVTQKKLTVLYDQKQKRSKELKREYADINKMSLLGWSPQINLEVGLIDMMNQYKVEIK